jgi:hypothetical protein
MSLETADKVKVLGSQKLLAIGPKIANRGKGPATSVFSKVDLGRYSGSSETEDEAFNGFVSKHVNRYVAGHDRTLTVVFDDTPIYAGDGLMSEPTGERPGGPDGYDQYRVFVVVCYQSPAAEHRMFYTANSFFVSFKGDEQSASTKVQMRMSEIGERDCV